MTRRTFILLGMIAVLPASAGTARASSITTYGVIITALGNDLQLQPIDQADATAALAGGSVGGSPAAGSTSGGTTTTGPISTATGTSSVGGATTSAPISTPTSTPISAPVSAPISMPTAIGGGADSSLLVTPYGSNGILVTPFGGSLATSPVATGPGVSPLPGSSSNVGGVGTTTAPMAAAPGVPQTVIVGTGIPTTPPTPVGVSTPLPPGSVGAQNSPEPASLTLLALASLGGLGYTRRRRA